VAGGRFERVNKKFGEKEEIQKREKRAGMPYPKKKKKSSLNRCPNRVYRGTLVLEWGEEGGLLERKRKGGGQTHRGR